jgi:hypothetical protein
MSFLRIPRPAREHRALGWNFFGDVTAAFQFRGATQQVTADSTGSVVATA